tara:strand:- start:217 stop:480 length:264 start_codon:yes stop_codon:yes gene_type:complete
MTYTKEQIEELKVKHEAIRTVLMESGNEEYGDCIIDEICEVVGIPPTTEYYEFDCDRCEDETRIEDYENGDMYSEDGKMPCPDCQGG